MKIGTETIREQSSSHKHATRARQRADMQAKIGGPGRACMHAKLRGYRDCTETARLQGKRDMVQGLIGATIPHLARQRVDSSWQWRGRWMLDFDEASIVL